VFRRCFGADPDSNIQYDADPDPDGHQKEDDPHADPSTSFTHVRKYSFFLLLVTALPVYMLYNVLSFSSVSKVLPFSVFWTAY
jgi:hypothetical protein